MFKGFSQRPSMRVAGRRRACCRTCSLVRDRSRATAPTAPPAPSAGPSSSAPPATKWPRDRPARPQELPTAVLSCVSPTVDHRSAERALCDACSSSTSSSGYTTWPFGITSTSCDPPGYDDEMHEEVPSPGDPAASTGVEEELTTGPAASPGGRLFAVFGGGSSRRSSRGTALPELEIELCSPEPGGCSSQDELPVGCDVCSRSSSDGGKSWDAAVAVAGLKNRAAIADAHAAIGVANVAISADAIDTIARYDDDVHRSETNATASSSRSGVESRRHRRHSSSSSSRTKRLLLLPEHRPQRHSASSSGSNSPWEAARPMGPSGPGKGGRHRSALDSSGSKVTPAVAPTDSRSKSHNAVGPEGDDDTAAWNDDESRSRSQGPARRDKAALQPWLEARRINRALVSAGAWRRHQEILQLVDARGQDFDRINTATALHRLGSCGLQLGSWEARQLLVDPRFSQLERLAGEHLPLFTPRELSNCLWALAKLGYRLRPDVHSREPRGTVKGSASCRDGAVGTHGSDGAGRLSGSTSTSSTSGKGSSTSSMRLLEGLCQREEALVGGLGPQEVANSLWALGTMGHHPGETLLRGLTNRLLQLLAHASHQDISNSLLGLAKLGWSPGAHVLDKVTRGSLPKIGNAKPQELSNSLWALSRLGYRNGPLQAAIFRQAQGHVADFKPQELSSLVLAAAILELGPEGGGGGSGGGRVRHRERVGFRQQGLMPEPLLRQLCDQAVATLARYGQRELSNLLWAIAKLGYCHETLLRAAASQAARQLEAAEEKHGDGGNGSGENPGPGSESGSRACDGGRDRCGTRHDAWSSQSVSSALWAYATLGLHPGAEFLRQVCRLMSCRQRLSRYRLEDLVHSIWALAALRHCDGPALEAVEQELVGRLKQAADASAAISTGCEDRTVEGTEEADAEVRVDALSERVLPRPQVVSDLLWAYASLQHPAPQLFAALLAPLEFRLPRFSHQALCNCMWAAATLGVYDGRLMDAVAAHVCSYRLPYLQPRELASLAWAYGELGHAHRGLFDGLASRMVSYVWPLGANGGVSHTAATLLTALATLCGAAGVFGWRYPALLDASERLLQTLTRERLDLQPNRVLGSRQNPLPYLAPTTLGNSTESGPAPALFSERDVASLAWGLSLVGGCSPQLWGQMMALLGQVAEERGSSVEGLSEETLMSMCQAYMHMRLDHPTAQLSAGPPGLLRLGASLLRQRLRLPGARRGAPPMAPAPSPSADFPLEVSCALGRLGFNSAVGATTDDGLFSIALALEVEVQVQVQVPDRGAGSIQFRGWRQQPAGKEGRGPAHAPSTTKVVHVAVEAEGPAAFTSNTRQQLSTILYRRRCLEARGWVVVSVPYWRWCETGGCPTQQDALLLELMQERGLQGRQVLAAAAAAAANGR